MSALITFPPGVLDPGSVRLPILARGEGWFAVDKPAGLVLAPDGFHAEDTPSIVGAIQAAATAGKPQLVALGITGCSRIHALDSEESGVAVLAGSEQAAATMRNHQGSGRWEFIHEFVSEAHDGPDEIVCDLPLLPHVEQPRMIVSHRAGKRSRTVFTLVRRLGGYAVWEASTVQNRPHQVRVHAAECGLRIVGESLYVRVRQVYLSSLKRGYRPGRDEERPLHPGLALRMREIRPVSGTSSIVAVQSPRPKSFSTLVKRLDEHG